jgi:trigger factor
VLEKIITSSPEVKYDKVDKDGITFFLTFPAVPVITIDKYDDLKIETPSLEVTDQEVDNEINQAISQDIMLQPKESGVLADGDMADINFNGKINGKEFPGGKSDNFQLLIGSNTFVPGFEEQLIGMKVGETKNIDITFPANYRDMGGKKAVFEVKLLHVSLVKKPQLNEAYLSKFTFAVMKNEADLRKVTKKRIAEFKKEQSFENLKQSVCEKMVKKIHPSYIPNVFLVDERDRLINQVQNEANKQHMEYDEYLKLIGYKNDDDFQEKVLVLATNNITIALGFDKIVKDEKITVSPKEIDEKIETVAKAHHTTAEVLKKQLNNKFEAINSIIEQEKVINHILSVNKIKI